MTFWSAKIGNFLVALTFLGFSFSANASFSAINKPLKILTCDVLLDPSLRKLAVKDNILPILRDANHIVSTKFPQAATGATSYKNFSYNGAVAEMKSKTAELIDQRLRGIEEDLTSSDLDHQVVAIEVRGADLAKALEKMNENEKNLKAIYANLGAKTYSLRSRISSALLSAMITWGAYDYAEGLISHLMTLDFASLTSLIIPGYITWANYDQYQRAFRHNYDRYDWNYPSVKEAIQKAVRDPSFENFYISSSSIELPAEFHRMLLSDDRSVFEADAREIAVKKWGAGYTRTFLRKIFSGELFGELRREVQEAGDVDRRVYLDHVVFRDSYTNEPVWLFVYRAFRDQPAGRKPKEHREEQTQSSWDLIPGSSPVPVPVGVPSH